jgi:hypothetical protein
MLSDRPILAWFLALAMWLGIGIGTAMASNRPNVAGLLPILTAGSADPVAGSLRGYLVHTLTSPLYETSPGWGRQRRGRNQGVWRKIRFAAVNLPDTLIVDLRNVRLVEPGRMTFTLFLSFDARVEYQQQSWEAGVRLLDASARARLRLRLTLDGEASTRIEPGVLLAPEAVFRLRVTRSDLRFDDFVLEHIAGIGGEAAKLFGEALRHRLHEGRPSLEDALLARANAAIVKAGDTKEVRLSLFTLFKNTSQPAALTTGPSKPAGS